MSEATVADAAAAAPEKMVRLERSSEEVGANLDSPTYSSVMKEQEQEQAAEPTDAIWLEWEAGDPENPFNVRPLRACGSSYSATALALTCTAFPPNQWSNRKKWQTCLFACVFTLVSPARGGSVNATRNPDAAFFSSSLTAELPSRAEHRR